MAARLVPKGAIHKHAAFSVVSILANVSGRAVARYHPSGCRYCLGTNLLVPNT